MKALRLLPVVAAVAMGGCDNMKDQPHRESGELRAPAHTVSRDEPFPGDPEESGFSEGRPLAHSPIPFTRETLLRGRGRFAIYCAPCHGEEGYGGGIVVRRGFPAPPSYHSDRLRGAPDGHLFDVITRGYGAMLPFADRIAPRDRWAIVGYIRALQRSQHASLADVPASARGSLAP